MDLTDAELSLLCTDDATIQELNRTWRGRDKATDVLSFPQEEGEGITRTGAPRMLGDVVISMDTAARQAADHRHELAHEVDRLLVHGILHLLGYDHEVGASEARRMRRQERRLLALLPRE